jgi:hypothetical protein
METPWQGLQGFSGATAVGALVFVDLALVANAFADNLFPVINIYSQTPTWAIVVAIPAVSLAYLLGVLSIGASELILVSVHLLDAKALVEDTISVAGRGEYAAARFQQIRQEAELLAGGAIAFALLSLGAALSAWRIEGWRRFLTAVAIMAVLLAGGSILLCFYRYRMAHRQAVATVRR